MRISIGIFGAAAAMMIAGCAINQVRPTADDIADANTPLFCSGAEQCALAWRRAQLWVVNNAHWKIQTATDVVIDTFNGDPYTPYRRFRITREPVGNGQERIIIASACSNKFGCASDELIEAASFKRYVRAGF